ncbi:MAG: hypothetical protein H7840_02875 [Alphaproteobacteria bacterium]
MASFDPRTLLENVDPLFRHMEAQQFAELVRQAGQDGDETADPRVEYYDKAIRLTAAAIYMIARDLNLSAGDIAVVATFTVGTFSGASSHHNDETTRQIKDLFAAAFDDACADKTRAASFMADIVGDGIDMIRRLGAR